MPYELGVGRCLKLSKHPRDRPWIRLQHTEGSFSHTICFRFLAYHACLPHYPSKLHSPYYRQIRFALASQQETAAKIPQTRPACFHRPRLASDSDEIKSHKSELVK